METISFKKFSGRDIQRNLHSSRIEIPGYANGRRIFRQTSEEITNGKQSPGLVTRRLHQVQNGHHR